MKIFFQIWWVKNRRSIDVLPPKQSCDMINIKSISEWSELCAVAGEPFQASHCLY